MDATFLAAIRDAPDEAGPRLVYADWLDEHGQPERAEFIRVQVELAAHPHGDNPLTANNRVWHLRCRERELLKGNWGKWYGFPIQFFSLRATRFDFRRGFVETVTCAAIDWLAHGKAVLQAQPVVKVVLDGGMTLERGGSSLDVWQRMTWEIARNIIRGRYALHFLEGAQDVSWAGQALTTPAQAAHVDGIELSSSRLMCRNPGGTWSPVESIRR